MTEEQNTAEDLPTQPAFSRGDHTELGEYLVSNGPPMVTRGRRASSGPTTLRAAYGSRASRRPCAAESRALAGSPIITDAGTRRALHVNVASARGAIEMVKDETEDPRVLRVE